MNRLDISLSEDPAGMLVVHPDHPGVWTIAFAREADKRARCERTVDGKRRTVALPQRELRGLLCVSVWSPDETFSSSSECGVFPVNSEEEALALYQAKCDQYRDHKQWGYIRVEIIDGCYPVGDGTWAPYDSVTASGWFSCEETLMWGQVLEAGGTLHVFDPQEGQWVDWSDSLPTTRAAEADVLEGLTFLYQNGEQVEYGLADSAAISHDILKEHMGHFRTLLEAATDPQSLDIKARISSVQSADPLAFLATFP